MDKVNYTADRSACNTPDQVIGVPGCTKIDGPYAKYVLVVMVLVSILNFLDRSIIGILIEDIKADLNLSDADIGFLGGTAFTVFYATFGVALGRLADVWNRKKLITAGLGIWSLMTALSGLARSFIPLAACRFGVGIGEASASPAIYSLLYDYFSPRFRTTVTAVYLSGAAIGSGLGIFLGGMILDTWNAAWPDAATAPLGIKGWQAAFMIVGLPGILMAFWVSTLREPLRGQADGIVSKPHAHPFREAALVLLSMLPIGNFLIFSKSKNGRSILLKNLLFAISITFAAYVLTSITGDALQWITLSAGIYAAFSWIQALAIRDPVVYGMLFNCKTLRYIIIGDALIGFNMGASFWIIPLLQRYFNISAADIGSVLGIATVLLGVAGIIVGGILADFLRTRTSKGKLFVYLAGAMCTSLSILILVSTDSKIIAYVAVFSSMFAGSLALGPVISTVNDLVLPRGRATTIGIFFMITLLCGSAIAPYIAGSISDALIATGKSEGEALRKGMLWCLLAPVVGAAFIVQAIRHIKADETTLTERARLLGEPI